MAAMRSSTQGTQTVTITQERPARAVRPAQPQSLVLRLGEAQPPKERRVSFTPDTIDNEHLGRLKSNCCCIYVPPRRWDDESTWVNDECETEHCRGHTLPPPPPPKPKPDSS